MPGDNLDTIIQHVTAGYPEPGASPVRPAHRVLWFAVGTGLWLADGILLYALVWFLRHW